MHGWHNQALHDLVSDAMRASPASQGLRDCPACLSKGSVRRALIALGSPVEAHRCAECGREWIDLASEPDGIRHG